MTTICQFLAKNSKIYKKFLNLYLNQQIINFMKLYCTETIPISKSQKLLHKLFDDRNEKRKSNESKRRKTK
jgi:hypothetical protein